MMGMRYTSLKEDGPLPWPGVLMLTCDGHRRDLLQQGGMVQTFRHPDGFTAMYSHAMRAGWKDTFIDGERVFLGPCCSGKMVGD